MAALDKSIHKKTIRGHLSESRQMLSGCRDFLGRDELHEAHIAAKMAAEAAERAMDAIEERAESVSPYTGLSPK